MIIMLRPFLFLDEDWLGVYIAKKGIEHGDTFDHHGNHMFIHIHMK
jgi:hypothetical protein